METTTRPPDGPSSTQEDPVVAEVDLYITQPPANHDLHVLQYPLRHAKIGVGAERPITNVNIRPNYGRLEVKLGVLPYDPATITDDMDCAQRSTRSFDNNQETAPEKAIGQIQTLRSRMNLAPADCNYAVAALLTPPERSDDTPLSSSPQKPSFVIVPVHAVSQLRPAFDYIDNHEVALLQQRLRETQLRSNVRNETGGDAEGVSPLELSFRRRESERAAERRRASHTALREKELEEAWVELKYTSASASESKSRLSEIFDPSRLSAAPAKENADVNAKISYADLFLEHTKSARVDMASQGSMGSDSSARSLKHLATGTAVAQVVAYARIVSFSDILLLIGDRPEKEVISAARSVGLCLRGCWVSRSGARDMRRQMSASERYEACRILVLSLFRNSRTVTTKAAELEIGSDLVISEDTLKSVLQEVAVLHRGFGWVLKVDDDVDFISRHEALCRSQDAEWDKRVASAKTTVEKTLRQIKR